MKLRIKKNGIEMEITFGETWTTDGTIKMIRDTITEFLRLEAGEKRA